MSQATAISPPYQQPKANEPAIDFRVLGSLTVFSAGKLIPLGGPKQRLVLALLIVEANRVVSADRLIDLVWGDEPPEAARGTLQAYMSRLRKTLGPGRIEARAPGYLLWAAPDEVDSNRFERLTAEARGRLESDPQAALSLLDAALDLWRGPALDDLAGAPAMRAEISRLEELHLSAVGYRIEARMALGHHAELVGELERLVAEHPLREPFSASLMLALYRSERQAEALAAFERIRHLVGDELGVDPSPGLRRLHERILKQDPDLLPKGRRLRGYELTQRIGEGTTGVVYRAVQPTVRRDVAIKVIHRGLANQPEFIRRFEQEAQLVARLEHPRIVPLHDYWREPEGAYLVMRHIAGGSLKHRLEMRGPLTASEANDLVDQICSALAFAHRQGVVHRDVRPTNILYDEEGNAYLSDFGIAIELAVAGALSRRYGGFAYYLAPEEVRSQPISPATDVYGLGLMLYEALAGRHAFADSPSSEILDRQLGAPAPPLSLARPDLPPAVGAVITRATEKAPPARYQDASSFAAAFREALATGSTHLTAIPRIERNPYKGLRAFDEADAPNFFGREQLTAQLVNRLVETGPGCRLLALVGPSGSGKSSAVRAGLLPAIRRGEVPGSEHWFVVEMHPGVQPFRELESAFIRVATHYPPRLGDTLESVEHGILQAANTILPADDSELLVFVDQFEELFTLVPEEGRRNKFLSALADAASDPASRVRLVITLRADFYDRPLLHPTFGDLLASRTLAVPPMRSEDLERAVVAPADATGVTFESGLIGAVVGDVANEPGSLPLLQYAITELFDQRTDSTITLAAYGRMGGISGALARSAEELYQSLDESAKEAARQVLLRLVSLGEEGSDDTRRRVLKAELAALVVDQRAIEHVIELFGAHRFLTFDRDPATRGQTVEVAHEALLSSWPRLHGWIESGREDLRTYRRFSAGAREWEAAGRDPSFLLRGSRLEHLESWAKASHVAMSNVEREYLASSLQARDKERTEQRARDQREVRLNKRALNRLRVAVATLLIGVVAGGTLAAIAQERGTRAEQEARIATARQLAANAAASIPVNEDRALQLALQAVNMTRSVDGTVLPEAEEVLHAAIQADRVLLAMPGQHARFSADGNRLLIVGVHPGQADLRDATSGKLISRQTVAAVGIPGEELPTRTTPKLAITPDGKRFVTGGGPHGVAVYDLSTGERLRQLGTYCCADLWVTADGRHVNAVQDLGCGGGPGAATHLFDLNDGAEVNCFPWGGLWAFSPDGARGMVATIEGTPDTGPQGAVYIGNLLDPGARNFVRFNARPDVNGVAWSGDGSLVGTSSPNSVMIWDANGAGMPLFTLSPPTGSFTTLAFSVQPGLLATAISDGSVIVWRLSRTDARAILRLAGHDGLIRNIAFHPDGKRLVTSGDDGLVKVWDLTAAGGGESVSVAGSGGFGFSGDGHLIGTGSTNGQVRVYEADSGKLIVDLPAHSSSVEAVGFGRSDATVVSAASDGITMSKVGGGTTWSLRESQGSLAANVAISPDGAIVAIPGEDATIRILDAGIGSQIRSLSPPFNCTQPMSCLFFATLYGQALAFSRNGKFLVIAGGFPGCAVMEPTGRLLGVLGNDDIAAVAISPNGERVAALNARDQGGKVVVYELTKFGRVVGTMAAHSQITSVAFSPDGSRIATSETDGAVRLWDATTLKSLMVLATDADGKVVFSPDGTRLMYEAKNEVVRVLAVRIDDLIHLAQSRLARSQKR